MLDEMTGDLYLRRSLVDEARKQYTVRDEPICEAPLLVFLYCCFGLNVFVSLTNISLVY